MATPEEVRARLAPPLPQHVLAGWLAPLGVTLFAFAIRLHRLRFPTKEVFDETYYRKDAYSLLKHGVEIGENGAASFVVHPPFGKWLIALGEGLGSYDSFGWRISAAIAGALSILVLCRLGRRLFRSTLLGCLAGFLLSLDGLHFVQSRIAMLDIFLLLWVVAALACLVADRDDMRAKLAARLDRDLSYPGPKLGFRWWRLAAGVCLGAAIATKWSAIFYVVALVLLSLAWDVGARRTAGIPAPFRAAIWRELIPIGLLLLAVPFALYVFSWAGWFLTDDGFARDQGALRGFISYHRQILDFHSGLDTPHPYQSNPWGWLLLARPVSYWYTAPIKDTSEEILGIGTPAIWWASIPALFAVMWSWISRRDWRAAAILIGFAAGYLPWLFQPDRTMFLFYALPAVPFLCLALAYCAGLVIGPSDGSVTRRRVGGAVVAAYTLLVVVNFFGLYPILAAEVIPYSSWHDRMWFTTWI